MNVASTVAETAVSITAGSTATIVDCDFIANQATIGDGMITLINIPRISYQ